MAAIEGEVEPAVQAAIVAVPAFGKQRPERFRDFQAAQMVFVVCAREARALPDLRRDEIIERRLLGFIQMRLGPNRVGPFGLLQPLGAIARMEYEGLLAS